MDLSKFLYVFYVFKKYMDIYLLKQRLSLKWESAIIMSMKPILLVLLLCFSLPAAVFAGDEGHTIKIIRDDGSVEVIDLRKSAQSSPPEPDVKTQPKPTEIQASVPAQDDAPAPVKRAKKKAVKKAYAPPPPRTVKPPPLPVQRKIQSGATTTITRGKAISIAMGYAPPSSDVEVFRSEYEGTPVFAVVFKTEDGFHEVLIDDQSGKVLESRESQDFSAKAAPGHLPADLR